MRKAFRINGLDCANCAAKIERAISALDGVENCSVSFLTGKMTLEADDEQMDAILESAKTIIRKTEPGAVLG